MLKVVPCESASRWLGCFSVFFLSTSFPIEKKGLWGKLLVTVFNSISGENTSSRLYRKAIPRKRQHRPIRKFQKIIPTLTSHCSEVTLLLFIYRCHDCECDQTKALVRLLSFTLHIWLKWICRAPHWHHISDSMSLEFFLLEKNKVLLLYFGYMVCFNTLKSIKRVEV